MEDLVHLLQKLMACPSITPNDAGCQKIIREYLEPIGFHCESMPFADVENLWATYGDGLPLVVFAGHTDVVPTGPITDWTSPPFVPTLRDGHIYGRGAADMKGAISAMLIATKKFMQEHANFSGTLAFLITSDEEGASINGTKKVIEVLQKRGKKIDYCIIGEPSSIKKAGDQVRIGRRGSLHGKLIIRGKQGHVAHPHLAINPIHNSMLALHELAHTKWDDGNTDFPPTTFQISNINAGTGASNVIPGHLEALFNFRFSTAISEEQIKKQTQAILDKHGLNYDIEWSLGAKPFLTKKGKLVSISKEAIQEVTGFTTEFSTGGGTSDGRFIAPTGAEVVEIGVTHATAHHINESALTKDLENLTNIYAKMLTRLFT